MQALIDARDKHELPVELSLVVSNKKDAFAIERAKKASIQTELCLANKAEDREDYDKRLQAILLKHNIEWIVLAGFMRILSPGFVQYFSGRVINLHPSLLPKFPGLDSIERAFEAGEPELGVTVHFVDEGVDTGPIILQESVKVDVEDSLETVTEKVHELEHRLLPRALKDVVRGKVQYIAEKN